MKNAQKIFKDVDFLSRLLTSNPYTAEGKSILNGLNVNLTTDQFFEEKLYAEPVFLENQSVNTNHVNYDEEMDDEDLSDSEDYIFVSDDNSRYKNLMIESYEKFVNSFNNLHELPLLFIRGGSGTGKSTFMYSLIHELLKDNSNIKHTELTLEKYSDRPFYYGIPFPIKSDTTISRFAKIVFTKIFSIINCEINNAKESNNYTRINDTLIRYKKSFAECSSENPININVFNAFCNPLFQNLDKIEHNKKVITECIKLFSTSDIKTILYDLLLLLIELCYCLYSPKYNLISFDGIEYLINRTHHIYDSDINDILSVFEKTKHSAEYLFEECNLEFADNFKIVLAIRNATLDYSEKREQENIRDSNISVDVTNWYRLENIYDSRIKYFSKTNYICEEDFDKIKDIVEIVIKDSKKGRYRANSAMGILERMYNFDKRSLQSNLLTAVSQIALGAGGGILKDKFIELYNDVGPMVYNPIEQGHRFRYLCRRAIIRILLEQIEIESRDTFFDGVYFSEYGFECIQSSYMRKMLIFLLHNQVNNNKIADDYVPFDSVINAIARPKNNSFVDPQKLEQIITLIYRLSDYRLHDSAWQQLISIKFNYPDKQIFSDEKNFVSKVKELYFNNELSKEDFGVKLNYAGAFLAYIQSDFEFFACRCKEFKIPLIFTRDVTYIKSLLDAVHFKAIDCIKMVIRDEKDIFGNYRDMYLPEQKYLYKDYAYKSYGRLISHPKRIINNHITYLKHYRFFVNETEGIFSDDDKAIIIDKVDQVINKYKLNFNDLVDGYGSIDGDFAGEMFLKDYANIPYLWNSNKL